MSSYSSSAIAFAHCDIPSSILGFCFCWHMLLFCNILGLNYWILLSTIAVSDNHICWSESSRGRLHACHMLRERARKSWNGSRNFVLHSDCTDFILHEKGVGLFSRFLNPSPAKNRKRCGLARPEECLRVFGGGGTTEDGRKGRTAVPTKEGRSRGGAQETGILGRRLPVRRKAGDQV